MIQVLLRGLDSFVQRLGQLRRGVIPGHLHRGNRVDVRADLRADVRLVELRAALLAQLALPRRVQQLRFASDEPVSQPAVSDELAGTS